MSNELPQGWTIATLGSLTKPSRPRREPKTHSHLPFIGMEQVEPHTRRLLGTLPAASMKSAAFHFLPGDILYGRLRPYLNKVLCASFEGLCSSEFIVLPPSKLFEPRYLTYYLNNDKFVMFANSLNQGDRPRVNYDQIASHEVPLPPFAEQQRIVAKLEVLLERVKNCQKRLDRIPIILKRFRQSVLAAACSGKLTADWRVNNSDVEPAAVRIEHIKSTLNIKVRRNVPEEVFRTEGVEKWRLPNTWAIYSTAELLRCGAFVDVKDGNHGANHPKVAEFTKTGTPFITAAQVNNFRIDYDGAYKLAGKPLERIHVGFAKHGDVIYTHKGSVGRVAIADRDCVLTPQTTYYRVNPDVFVNTFLMYYLASQPFSEQVNTVKEQTTRDFVPISEQYLLFHRIPPVTEQTEIVRRVSNLFAIIDNIEGRYICAEHQVDKLTQSILAKAFRGELVPQDPRDEPASMLLERIKIAPSALKSTKRSMTKRGKTK